MNTNNYEKSWVAVDAVIFTIRDGQLQVYLHEREKEPYIGKFELLGGLLLQNETAEETLGRKFAQTFGESKVFFQQFHTFTSPARDPRERAVSIGYIALVPADKIADQMHWYGYSALPDLAFDHKEIIMEAYQYLGENLNHLIAKQFMPARFPLNDLQRVYEVIEGKEYDNRNFRKKMIGSEIVVETDEMQKDVPHRPAKLYKFA